MSSKNRFFRAGLHSQCLIVLAVFLLCSCYSSPAAVNLGEIDNDLAPVAQAPAETPVANPTAQDAPPQQRNYLVWMVRSLGWFFTPVFLVMSIIMVAFVVINLLAIRREVLHPNLLVEEFGKLLDEKKFQEAFDLAKENDSLLAKVLAAGLSKMSRGYEQIGRAHV